MKKILPYCIREYRKALPWLNLISEDPDKIPREQYEQDMERLDRLEASNRDLTQRVDDSMTLIQELSDIIDTPDKKAELEAIAERLKKR